MQLLQEKKHLIRYKSKIWFSIKKNFNITKKKYNGVFIALKKTNINYIR